MNMLKWISWLKSNKKSCLGFAWIERSIYKYSSQAHWINIIQKWSGSQPWWTCTNPTCCVFWATSKEADDHFKCLLSINDEPG